MVNLHEHITADGIPADIVLVVASRACPAVERAERLGLHAVVQRGDLTSDELLDLVRTHDVDLVLLAGYLRLLPIPVELDRRVMNIHPALLPDFGGPGMHGRRVHEAVLAAFRRGEVTESGCTVHWCDATYDTGPIIHRRTCPIVLDDTAETLAARVFEQERLAYPQALERVLASDEWARRHDAGGRTA